MITTEEQTRISEIKAGLTVPENAALLQQLVQGLNHVYSIDGLNMMVQVHSVESQEGKTFVGYIIDNESFPGKVISVKVNPDGTTEEPVLSDPNEE